MLDSSSEGLRLEGLFGAILFMADMIAVSGCRRLGVVVDLRCGFADCGRRLCDILALALAALGRQEASGMGMEIIGWCIGLDAVDLMDLRTMKAFCHS